LIFVKPIELTISSSVWRTSHPTSLHLRCGTTLSVVSIRAPLDSRHQSLWSVHAAWRRTDRYLIVQFPMNNDKGGFRELEVYIRRKFLNGHSVIIW